MESVQIYESEFGGLPVDKTSKQTRLDRAKLTRDAFMYGGFENAILHKLEKIMDETPVIYLRGSK